VRILIVGGGKSAEEVVRSIDLKENQVYIVEVNPERKQELMSKYDVVVIGRDARDPSLYTSEIDLSQIDMVLALTDSDEINVFVLAIAKIYNVPHRIARVSDKKVAELIRQLELGVPIAQPCIVSSLIKNYIETVTSSSRLASFSIGDNTYFIHLVTTSEADLSVGGKIEDLERRAQETGVFLKVLLLFDGEKLRVPEPSEEVKAGYQLIILSSAEDIDRVVKG